MTQKNASAVPLITITGSPLHRKLWNNLMVAVSMQSFVNNPRRCDSPEMIKEITAK